MFCGCLGTMLPPPQHAVDTEKSAVEGQGDEDIDVVRSP